MMTRKEVFEEELFYGFSLDAKVPQDHLLRKIKQAIDFSFIYELVEDKYSTTGAPSIDPVVVFKLLLIGYLYNIPSERRLIEDAALNMAYLWFTDYKITEPLPDHSIFTKVRIRFGKDAFIQFFDYIVKACVDAGLTQGDTVYLDATIIDANVSDNALRSRALVEQLKKAAGKYVDNLNWQDDDQDPPLSPKAKVNSRLINREDHDAQVITHKNQKSRIAYKGHIAVDGGLARIVTVCKLTGGAFPEEHLLWDLACAHELATDVSLKNLSADTRYCTIENMRFLKAKKILPAIPLRKGGRYPAGGFSKDQFSYREIDDNFTCPEGRILSPAKPVGHWKTYRSKKADCSRCLSKNRCLVGAAKRRTIMISTGRNIMAWAKSQSSAPEAKKLLRKRKIYPETIFANAKSFHGLGRAKFKGRWKVEIQALMTFTAINLKKLVKYGGKKPAGIGHRSKRVLVFELFVQFWPAMA